MLPKDNATNSGRNAVVWKKGLVLSYYVNIRKPVDFLVFLPIARRPGMYHSVTLDGSTNIVSSSASIRLYKLNPNLPVSSSPSCLLEEERFCQGVTVSDDE